jgi:hypothetical protein
MDITQEETKRSINIIEYDQSNEIRKTTMSCKHNSDRRAKKHTQNFGVTLVKRPLGRWKRRREDNKGKLVITVGCMRSWLQIVSSISSNGPSKSAVTELLNFVTRRHIHFTRQVTMSHRAEAREVFLRRLMYTHANYNTTESSYTFQVFVTARNIHISSANGYHSEFSHSHSCLV